MYPAAGVGGAGHDAIAEGFLTKSPVLEGELEGMDGAILRQLHRDLSADDHLFRRSVQRGRHVVRCKGVRGIGAPVVERHLSDRHAVFPLAIQP